MTDDGIYIRITPGRNSRVGAQRTFMKEAQSFASSRVEAKNDRVFVAEEKHDDTDGEVLRI